MKKYRFTGLTDATRLVETMAEKSKMPIGEASWLVRKCLERCVEVWEGDSLLGYFLIFEQDGVRQLHGYKLCKGKTRLALRVALEYLKNEKRIYSAHREANLQVNRLLKILGFKEIGRDGHAKDMVVLERPEQKLSVQ